jgi:thiaminase/transcriptional activator TenA
LIVSFSAELKENALPAWQALERHPFVAQMADGSLSLDSFRFYIDQNLLYLPEYARALSLGIVASADGKELVWFTKAVDNIVHVEIPENELLRDRVSQLGGHSHPHSHVMAPATLAYTSYLIATASRTDALGVMALILPCAWTYQDIALANKSSAAEHPVYGEWLRFFSTDDYDTLVQGLCADMDSLAARADSHRRAEVSHIFTTGVRLEQAFWDMALGRHHWPDLQ